MENSYIQYSLEAHRGAGHVKENIPENTILAFQKAISIKADFIELDVHHTEDEILIVTHGKCCKLIINDVLEEINKITYSKLKQSRVFHPSHLDQQLDIPTLAEIFAECKGKIKLNIEIKGKSPKTLYLVLKLAKEYQMFGEFYLSAFKHFHFENLEIFKNLLGIQEQINVGYLFGRTDKENKIPKLEKIDTRNQNNSLNFSARLINNEIALKIIRQIQASGIKLKAYFPFDIKENFEIYQKLAVLGVTGFIVNDPELFNLFKQQSQYK